MGSRLDLQTIFEELLGSENVYFQEPPNIGMAYPCIIYKPDVSDTKFADNVPYRYTNRYMVTVIDPNPDSDIPKKIASLPMCVHNRFYVANNLRHNVFLMYF